MKFTEQYILDMVKSHTTDNMISCDVFDKLFSGLSGDEQDEVIDILASRGITLQDTDDFARAVTAELPVDNSAFGGKDPADFSGLTKQKGTRMNEQLVKAAQEGNKEALERLCLDNRGLVMKMVSRYAWMCGNALAKEDLFMAGIEGVMKAAECFRHDYGCKFSTYAEWWIRQAIKREIENNGYVIRIPTHKLEQMHKVNEMNNDLFRRGIPPADRVPKIAAALGLDKSLVQECIRLQDYVMSSTSLNIPVGEDGDSVLGDCIPADPKDNAEYRLEQTSMKSDVMNVVRTLSPREQQVIIARFGLDGKDPRTLEEIAKDFGVTRERIRQIEARALMKLRHSSRSNKLKIYTGKVAEPLKNTERERLSPDGSGRRTRRACRMSRSMEREMIQKEILFRLLSASGIDADKFDRYWDLIRSV